MMAEQELPLDLSKGKVESDEANAHEEDVDDGQLFNNEQDTHSCSVIRPVSNTDEKTLMEERARCGESLLPRCKQPNLTSVGQNRMSYPREFKLMVTDYYLANGQNKYRTCKQFQITKSMLNGWLQKIDKIRQSRPGSLKSGRSGRRPQFPKIEKQLYELYQQELNTATKQIGNRWLRETAKGLARDQCSEVELAGMCQFSERWLSNFKKRYQINLNRDWAAVGSDGASSSSTTATTTLTVSPTSSPSPPAVERTSTANLVQPQTQLLPVQQFYRQFPWLERRVSSGGGSLAAAYEPGRRGRKVQFPQVEKVLYERAMARRAAGERLSNRWLQEEARRLAGHICPSLLAEATKSARCMFSEHWLHNFKKRYGVSIKKVAAGGSAKAPQQTVAAGASVEHELEQRDEQQEEQNDELQRQQRQLQFHQRQQQQQQQAWMLQLLLPHYYLPAALSGAGAAALGQQQQPQHKLASAFSQLPLTDGSGALPLAQLYQKLAAVALLSNGQQQAAAQ